MGREWSESLWLALEIMGTAVVLSLLIIVLDSSDAMYGQLIKQDATAAILKDVRKWSSYDNKDIYAADLRSLWNMCSENEETKSFQIKESTGSVTQLIGTSNANNLLSNYATATRKYHCTITRDTRTKIVTNILITVAGSL